MIALRPGALRKLSTALLVVTALAWVVFLRPQFLGGPVSYVMVSGLSMEPTLHNGDLVLARRRPAYGKGDIVAYRIPQGEAGAGSLVIHRIIGGSEKTGFVIQGDNRDVPDIWQPKHEDIIGESWARVPAGGRALALLHSPLALALFSTVLAGLLGVPRAVGEASSPRRRGGPSDARRAPLPTTPVRVVAAVPAVAAAATTPPVKVDFPYVRGGEGWGEAAWTARDVLERDVTARSGR